jgi:hypothetical protein
LKFDGQLGTWLEKFKTKNQTGKGVKLKKLEVCLSIEGQNAQI